ncbi:hypothetical protein JHK84_056207 [Glycine max]|uniref:Uncharacterized protein n=2 Tax=Glycine subgen. Soja TaxID=1462606 RepID=A0A0R0EC77_SOYBN|nr:hypothetical protein JHK86_056157 [Glycine max]KAG4910298.1 hypothetical protein JHK87_056414 [Glycine soja]KAG4918900.1 hypothetical protein JHK85_057181 [Glycine max]KAG5074976.1 hypothetical protein JHK84_056207 [Glycine max]
MLCGFYKTTKVQGDPTGILGFSLWCDVLLFLFLYYLTIILLLLFFPQIHHRTHISLRSNEISLQISSCEASATRSANSNCTMYCRDLPELICTGNTRSQVCKRPSPSECFVGSYSS